MLEARPDRPWIVAHRGASGLAPENTRAAFEQAIALGADWVETDLRRAQDGTIVLAHDRFRGAPPAGTERWEEMLALLAGKIGIDAEIKEPGFEASVIRALRERVPLGSYCITSFRPDVLRRVRSLDADVPTGLIVDGSGAGARAYRALGPRALMRRCGASVIACHHALADREGAAAARREGVNLAVWTVNDAEHALRLARAGVGAIIGDRPDLLLSAFAPGWRERRPA